MNKDWRLAMNTRKLIASAPERLENAPASKRVVLIYAGILTALAAVTTLLSFLLGLQIDKAGGLSNMGTRSTLSALRTMLPIVQTALSICLTLGYRAAMLRVARGQYVSPQTLRLGFDRFWLLLRTTLLKALIFLPIAMVSIYLATTIFVLSPLSRPVVELLAPVVSNVSALNPNVVLDDALYAQLMPAMTPVMVIFLVVFLLLAVPVALRYRMTDYIIIDKPATGAFAAMRESRAMMRGRAKKLFKLDLQLWWYYLALFGAGLLCYADQLLPLLGIALPISGTAAYYLFYALYLGVQFAIYYFLCNRIEVTYALFFEAIRPVETQNNGAVLGNIFQM